MHIFYSPQIVGKEYTLPEEESKHCIKVLRMKTGDEVFLTDGKGNLFRAIIASDHAKACKLQITEVTADYKKRNYHIHIAIAPTKSNDRFEWFLEKTAELGIDEITPLLTFHSERRSIKHDRLEKVLISAIKQSGNTYLPELNSLQDFKTFIMNCSEDAKFIAHCASDDIPHLSLLCKDSQSMVILIGPEGDFSAEEILLAKQSGFKEISLGTTRLRTETAGIAACHTVHVVKSL